jgi:hypothetical protein
MTSWFHAVSAQKKWGGKPEDYIEIEEFIDSSKRIIGDIRHRSVYHHTEGVWLCQELFGRTIELATGRLVPVRLIAERHIEEDLGWLPSPFHYVQDMELVPWMGGKQRREMTWKELQPQETK